MLGEPTLGVVRRNVQMDCCLDGSVRGVHHIAVGGGIAALHWLPAPTQRFMYMSFRS